MLVIRRREGESIQIGGAVEVLIASVERGRVKLVISAPPEIAVLRKEVVLTQEQNRRAAAGLANQNFNSWSSLFGIISQELLVQADMKLVNSRPVQVDEPAREVPGTTPDTPTNRM